jgi:hypothetical protein
MRFTEDKRGGVTAWILLVVLLAAIGYFVVYPKVQHARRFKDIKAEADDLAAKCRARGQASSQIRFPKRILIWDTTDGMESGAQKHLPDSLRAAHQDDLGTLLLVLDLRKEETTDYMPLEGTTLGGPPEYRYTYTVGAVAWPKRQVAGTFKVVVDPPGMRSNTKDERGGNWFDRGLADWAKERAK